MEKLHASEIEEEEEVEEEEVEESTEGRYLEQDFLVFMMT